MSVQITSGPAFVYFSRTAASSYPASGATIYFLGTGERPPNLQLNPQWEGVINDIGGSMLPIEYIYQGEDGMLQVPLNKWNEAVYTAMATHGLLANARGSELWKDIGSLSQLEGLTFHTWVHFPYAVAKSFESSYALPKCYHFPACRMAGHAVGSGTAQNRRTLMIHCDRSLRETTSASTSGFILYDHTATYLPAVPPTVATGLVGA